ncbi:MAG: hypothetical protein DI536_15290 [Archangium gephyra]|uniref:Uncharacterized protein n=1 Tax=Archangium gephyra TaxID=48 RepID=A0A2W5UST6_9BACT|nr:MAG: hypothetical protein DI536_15290 [Archangium gephyra]
MKFLRQVLTFIVSGALAGVLIMSATGPGLVEMRTTAPSGDINTCWCAKTSRQGADMLVAYQMNATAVGAVLGLVAGIAFVIWRRKASATKLPPPPAAPAG